MTPRSRRSRERSTPTCRAPARSGPSGSNASDRCRRNCGSNCASADISGSPPRPSTAVAGCRLGATSSCSRLLSMSHASLRMIVHVCNGIWRPIAANADAEQRERFLLPLIAGDIKVAFALTEPNAGTGADLRCSVERDGDTLLPERRKAPDHVRDDRGLSAADRANRRHARGGGDARADGLPPR